MKGVGYGFAELGINCIEIFVRIHLLVFYTDYVGLDSSLAGLALGLAIFWDAILDPIVGYFSDWFRAKKGERFSFLPGGFLFLAFCIWAILNPPELKTPAAQFTYLLVFALLLNSAYTTLSVPYSALVGDLSHDSKERSHLIGWRLAFGNLGAIFGIAIPSYFLIRKQINPYGSTAWVIVALLALGTLISWQTAKKYNRPPTDKTFPRKFSLVAPLKNKVFLPLVAAYFVANMGLTFNSSLALYFYRLRLKFDEEQIQTVLLTFLVVFTLSIPFWIYAARFISKIHALMIGAGVMGLMAATIYPFLPPRELTWTLLFASVLGGALVGSVVLLESLLTDIVKEEEHRTGKDELGLYFGVWKMMGKISRGLALAVTGQILSWSRVDDLLTANLRLNLAFGPLVGCFFIVSVLILKKLSNARTTLK